MDSICRRINKIIELSKKEIMFRQLHLNNNYIRPLQLVFYHDAILGNFHDVSQDLLIKQLTNKKYTNIGIILNRHYLPSLKNSDIEYNKINGIYPIDKIHYYLLEIINSDIPIYNVYSKKMIKSGLIIRNIRNIKTDMFFHKYIDNGNSIDRYMRTDIQRVIKGVMKCKSMEQILKKLKLIPMNYTI